MGLLGLTLMIALIYVSIPQSSLGFSLSIYSNFQKASLPKSKSYCYERRQSHPLIQGTSPSSLNLFNNNSNLPGDALFTQVISDVDDTLKSSGGVNIAGVALGGIDVQYQRGDFYPGVAEFMLQLSLGTQRRQREPTPPKVAILTARAEEFKLALELKEDSKLAVAFRQAGENAGIKGGWGLGPVLYGSVAEWIVQYRKGLRKFTNFEQLIQQDPSGTIMNYIYVGDTGELDQEAGETMLREYPTYCKAVFLHVVSDIPNADIPVPPPKMINGRPLVFFRTYIGAALAATQLRFMTVEGLRRVIDAACAKLEDVPRDSDKWDDLLRDIERCRPVLTQY